MPEKGPTFFFWLEIPFLGTENSAFLGGGGRFRIFPMLHISSGSVTGFLGIFFIISPMQPMRAPNKPAIERFFLRFQFREDI